ncbi:hypothetical protein TraAM80_04593 [Trypanosoma rangeli]|uniref:Uncharacterized protein n=1 Tax=Trypanosoma rangeli TaxID=5698 RepID=A0A3R7MMP3_TRYRA|nr:uncharacterized protein TraAM80_04593 [Trypanosoma rangeli]RNF05302.1 hypothetical protein TraAM80_04593 [Trypanosoma rangeli]|eukprot:RNF05302.1 hypothetical protein TraAM80_04593 [Trypanosoma rangeli]
MAEHQVLFLGCLSVTLTELRVEGTVFPQEATRNDGAKFFVRVAVLPIQDSGTEERMNAFVDSSVHPLRSAEMAEDLLIPVMLQRALPTPLTGGDGGVSPSSAIQEQNGQKDLDAAAAPVAAAVAYDGEDEGLQNNVAEMQCNSSHQMGVELHLEFTVVRGSVQSVIAHRTVVIGSLLSVAHEKCGVVNARIAAAAALRDSSVWGQEFFSHTADNSLSLGESTDDAFWLGVELQFIVRALDMSEPLRVMFAAEREARTLLRMPQQKSQTMFPFPALRLPYGALPLLVLYQYYSRFCERFFHKALRLSNHVEKLLSVDANHSGSHRWSALSVVDMRPTLLGEDALAPLLATLYHCPSLCSLVLDQNGAGDFTCYWLSALFHKHRYLGEVSLCRNNIHECGAEQLLRLTRRNKRLTRLDASGNPCSPRILERIQRVTEINQDTLQNDHFNVTSTRYAYAASPALFAPSITKKALKLWAMLCVSSLKVDGSAFAGQCPSIIPQAALAPLLNEVMRTVALEISSMIQDPFIRIVFSDIETLWKATQIARHEDASSVAAKEDEAKGAEQGDLTVAMKHDQEGADVAPAAVDVEVLYSYSFLRIVVVTMWSMTREVDWAESVAVLKSIGRRQKEIGVVADDYRVALKAFIQALTTVCGREPVDVENCAAFLQCLALGVRTSLTV